MTVDLFILGTLCASCLIIGILRLESIDLKGQLKILKEFEDINKLIIQNLKQSNIDDAKNNLNKLDSMFLIFSIFKEKIIPISIPVSVAKNPMVKPVKKKDFFLKRELLKFFDVGS